MPRYCAVKLCKNRGGVLSKDNKRISFYPFPLRDQARLQQWVDNMRRAAWMPSRHQYLCSEHFTEDSFDLRWGIRYLKHTAVPTIFEDEDTQLQGRSPKTRGRADSSDVQEDVFTSSSPPPPRKRRLLLLKHSDLNNNNRSNSSDVCRGDISDVCSSGECGVGGDNRVFSVVLLGHLEPAPEHHGNTPTEPEPRPSQQHAAPSLVDASSIELCDRLAPLGSRGGPEETAVAALPCETAPLHTHAQTHTSELPPPTLPLHAHTHTSELAVTEDSTHTATPCPLLSENGEGLNDTGVSGEGLQQTSAPGAVPAEVTGAGGLMEEVRKEEEVETRQETEGNTSYAWTQLDVCVSGPEVTDEEEVKVKEAREEVEEEREEVKRQQVGDVDCGTPLWSVCEHSYTPVTEEEVMKGAREEREEVKEEVKRQEVKRQEVGDGAPLWSVCVCEHSYARADLDEDQLWRRVASLHAKMAALQRREDETLERIRGAETTLTQLRKQHIVTQERQKTLETHFTHVYLQ